MCFRRGVLSVEPLIYTDFLIQVSPSLCVQVMEISWKNEVQTRSLFSSIPNFPITMEISKRQASQQRNISATLSIRLFRRLGG